MCTNQSCRILKCFSGCYNRIRYRYDKKENPYNQGMVKNLKEILFSKTVKPLVNFREWVTEEEEDSIVASITKKFGGDIIKSNGKMDLEVGILGKDGKPLPDILQNLDYGGIDDSLKKDKGGKIALDDPFFFPMAQEERHGTRAEKAIALFEKMMRTGLKPDSITFLGLLTACNHSGLANEGQTLFNSMSEFHGITPSTEHLCCLVDLLGRAGRVGEAEEYIHN